MHERVEAGEERKRESVEDEGDNAGNVSVTCTFLQCTRSDFPE